MQHHPIAAALAAAVAERDSPSLSAALTETVRLRALLPGGPIEAHGREAVTAHFRSWFDDFDTVEMVALGAEVVADRLLIHYRLQVGRMMLRWICTQTAVCKVVDGRLAVIDLLCSGLREIGEHADVHASSGARRMG